MPILEDIRKELSSWYNEVTLQDYMGAGAKLLKIILIIVLARIVIKIGNHLLRRFFERQKASPFKVDERKTNTLKGLSQNMLLYFVYFITAIIILQELGVRVESIIATAGIGGLAIGFGAQNLVKDVISGFFILFEDQYAVGDFISIEEIKGTVEEIGLRITKIRGFKGDLNIIPNGQVTKVTNYSRGNSLAIVDIRVSYEMDIDYSMNIMEKVALKYAENNTDIVETPQVLGVIELADYGLCLRLIARTLPMKHWGVERELRKRLKDAFNKAGIEIPYPHRIIIQKNNRGGDA